MAIARTAKTVRKVAAKTTRKIAKPVAAAPAADEIARKIWLAGVGAYGQLFTEAQDGLGKITSAAQETFDDLVARGAVMEDVVKSKLTAAEPTQALMDVADRMQKASAERRAGLAARVEAVGKAMSEKLAPYATYMPGMAAAKMDQLTAQVEALTKEVHALQQTATPPKLAPVRRAPVAKAAKAAKAAPKPKAPSPRRKAGGGLTG